MNLTFQYKDLVFPGCALLERIHIYLSSPHHSLLPICLPISQETSCLENMMDEQTFFFFKDFLPSTDIFQT